MNAAKTNHISLSFDAISENEAFARMTAAMFMAQLNPTLDDVEDVKTAVSEAVTNAIIHGYEMGDDNISSNQADHQAAEEKSCPQVHMNCSYIGRELYIEISDSGVGIQDVAKAMEPLYTSKPQLDRSGMGFSFILYFSLIIAIFLASSRIFRLICTIPSSRRKRCISPIINGTAYVEKAKPLLSSNRCAAFVSPTAPI